LPLRVTCAMGVSLSFRELKGKYVTRVSPK
jgi:hypothetical protein